jgi:NTP pyrophosphatase (non-canonical NTP hydrolase)
MGLSCDFGGSWLGHWMVDVCVRMKESFAQLMFNINEDVFMERMRQNEKWGIQRHDNGVWLSILIEEVGEVAEAMQKGMKSEKETDANNLYEELIQVAAVASAWAEQIREGK